MKSMIVRLTIIVCLIILIAISYFSVYTPRTITILLDNSQSMRRYSHHELFVIASSHSREVYTFGETTRKNSELTFRESESVIDWEMIERDALCIVISDGYFKEKGRRPETVLPVRLDTVTSTEELFVHDVQLTSHVTSDAAVMFSLTLSSLSNKEMPAEVRITHRKKQLYSKNISVRPDSISTTSDSFYLTDKGLQEIVINVLYGQKIIRRIAYVYVEPVKTQLLITGRLSPEISYLRRYFADHPLYEVHTLLLAGDRLMYDNEFVVSLPSIDSQTTIISSGVPFKTITPDIVILSDGKLQRMPLQMKDLLQDPIPIDGVRIFPRTPDTVYHRAGNYPVVFAAEDSLYIAIADFHTFYVQSFHYYDAIMRRVLEIHERDFKKKRTWYLKNPFTYNGNEISIMTNTDMNVLLNQTALQKEMTSDGFEYKGVVPQANEVQIEIGTVRYQLQVNTREEPVYKTQNITALSTFADGVLLSPEKNYHAITKKLQRKKIFFSHYPLIGVLLLVILCAVWWREHRK